MSLDDFLKYTGGAIVTAMGAVVLSLIGVIRFGKKDSAEVQKLNIDSEVSLSKQALEWTIEFKARLDAADRKIDDLRKENGDLRKENDEMKKKIEMYINKYGHATF